MKHCRRNVLESGICRMKTKPKCQGKIELKIFRFPIFSVIIELNLALEVAMQIGLL